MNPGGPWWPPGIVSRAEFQAASEPAPHIATEARTMPGQTIPSGIPCARRARRCGRNSDRSLGGAACLRAAPCMTPSSCRGWPSRATGSGRSTSGASAALGCSPPTTARLSWRPIAPRACCFIVATWTRNGPAMARRRDPPPRLSSRASTPRSPSSKQTRTSCRSSSCALARGRRAGPPRIASASAATVPCSISGASLPVPMSSTASA